MEKFMLLYLLYILIPWSLILITERLVNKILDKKLTKYKQISPPHCFKKEKIEVSTKQNIIIFTITGWMWVILIKFIKKYLIPAIKYKQGDIIDGIYMLNCEDVVNWYENGNPFGYTEDYYLIAKDGVDKS